MTVDMKFTGDSNDAQAAIAKLERKYSDLENKIKHLKADGGKGATDDWSRALDGVVGRYATIAGGISVATRAATALVGENQKMLDQLDQVGAKFPELFTKFRIQSGASEKDVQNLIPMMKEQLVATPSATVADALKLQTQLASSGFNEKDVKSGDALNVMLKAKAATNDFGEGTGKAEDLVKTASMVLKGYGIEAPSAKQLEKLAAGQVALFEQSSIKSEDFRQIAPKMAQFKGAGMSAEESLGTFTALAEVLGGNKADSGMAQFVTRTATAGAHKERVDDLAKIGLKPEDIAIAPGGKGFFEAVDKLKSSLSKLDPVSRNNFLAKMYGEEALPTASILMDEAGNKRAKEFSKLAGDQGAFARNVQVFQDSRFASNERNKVQTEFSNIEQDRKSGQYTWQEHKAELDKAYTEQTNAASGPVARSFLNFGKVVEEWATSPFKMFGAMPAEAGLQRTAQDFNPNAQGGGQPQQPMVANEVVEKMVRALEENTEATKKATPTSGRQGRPVDRNGNRE